MNYFVTFEEPIPFRAGGLSGEIGSTMFWDTDPELIRHSTDPYIENIDDVIRVMSEQYPEVKNYKIRETLLFIKDIDENDKIRAKQEC